jgi:pimeloyl-ACP methyl ester carboxylesterase
VQGYEAAERVADHREALDLQGIKKRANEACGEGRRDFMEATLASLRANIGVAGQREVLVDQLPRLTMPTLIVWGVEDRVFPYWQGKEAVTLLQEGSLELLPDCGHLPHVEQPQTFASIVGRFLGERISGGEASGSDPIEFGGGKGRARGTRRRDRAANELTRKDHP